MSVALTAREHALLHARAIEAGLRPVDYARAKLLSVRTVSRAVQEGPNHLGPLLLAQLSRLGNNLNQIARMLHMTRNPPPPSLESLLQELRALLRRAAG